MKINNSNKGFIVQGVIALVALVLIGGGAYYAGTKKVDAPETDVAVLDGSIAKDFKGDVLINKVPEINDSTSDWKTYKNYGFEFKYPSNWTIREMASEGEFVSVNYMGNSFMVGAFASPQSDLSAPEFICKDTLWNKESLSGSSWSMSKCIEGRKFIGLIAANEEMRVTLEKILSTFKFTSPDTTSTESKSSITVISPNGEEFWQEGMIYEIKWTSKNIPLDTPGYVALMQNGKVIKTIKSIALNGGMASNLGGSFNWTIPQEFVTEASPGKFEIKISSNDNLISDSSDKTFMISASGGVPPITILSPNGGETYKIGDSVNIKWLDTSVNSRVVIYAVSPNDTGFGTNISGNILVGSSGIDDSSSYPWKVGGNYPIEGKNGEFVPQYPIKAGKYKIEICKTDKATVCDQSDKEFAITN